MAGILSAMIKLVLDVGDIFGLENGSVHRFTAEAIVHTTVWLLKRRGLEDLSLIHI